MNKKGDIASILFVVIILATIGILFFILNHINDSIFTKINTVIGDSDWNETQADIALDNIHDTDNVIWDYAFLGIFLGILIALGLTAYAIRISPVFYWIYGLISLTALATGVLLSNTWQDLSTSPEFATTITRFPITNMLLGSYFPIVVLAIIIITMVILFGKPPGERGFI